MLNFCCEHFYKLVVVQYGNGSHHHSGHSIPDQTFGKRFRSSQLFLLHFVLFKFVETLLLHYEGCFLNWKVVFDFQVALFLCCNAY